MTQDQKIQATIYTIDEMRALIDFGAVNDYDGDGELTAHDKRIDGSRYSPSDFETRVKEYPHATHTIWYDK